MANTEHNPILAAYNSSEELYDSAFALTQMLQAWSRPGRSQRLTPDAASYIHNNIQAAQTALNQIREQLAPWLKEEQTDDSNRR